MQKDESILTLQAKMAALEAELWRMQRRRKLWRLGALIAVALGVSVSMFAQSSSPTIESLITRLGNLEDRITKLEKRLTNDEVGSTNFPSGPDDTSSDKATQQQLSALSKAFRQLQDDINNGRGRIGASVIAPFHVVDGKGDLIFSVDGFVDGTVAYNKDGSYVRVGPNANGAMGVRIYAPNSKVPSGGLDMLTGGIGDMWVGSPGKALAAMTANGGVGDIGIFNESGKNLSDLTRYPGGGGVLKIANSSGQIVSMIDANPANNEGRAVFTDTGGQPLAKIGAAGSHGDILLGGEGKGFELWGRMIAGLP